MKTDCYVSGLINKTTKNFYTNTFTTGEEIDMEIFAHLYTGKHKELILLGLNFKLFSNLTSNLNWALLHYCIFTLPFPKINI